MKKNLGSIDRMLRIVIAGAVGVLYYQGTITGTLALAGLAGVLALTSFVSWCPLYLPLRWSTRKASSALENSLLDFALSAAAASCSSSRAQRPYRAASAVST
ncbi:MAG: hypothetical protein ACI80N_004262, partial [Gammaproteobacteria bacterium]